jgi:Arc/MetJ-type ribon-helix-helix transcriptional regulator
MELRLTPYLERFIEDMLETGRYRDAKDVIYKALFALDDMEFAREFREDAAEAFDPANADKRIEYRPGMIVEMARRIVSEEHEYRGPGSRHLYAREEGVESAYPTKEEIAASAELCRQHNLQVARRRAAEAQGMAVQLP